MLPSWHFTIITTYYYDRRYHQYMVFQQQYAIVMRIAAHTCLLYFSSTPVDETDDRRECASTIQEVTGWRGSS